MGPVWEANHVWLIFVLVIAWTAYPVAYGSITSTLAAPLLIAAIGIIFRGAAYALRGALDESRFAEYLFALSSVLTPFALGTAVGAIATGRVPVGNALGNPVTSWLNPASALIGALAVVFSGYLAAVYLAADSLRHGNAADQVAGVARAGAARAGAGAGAGDGTLANAFRRRALAAGLVCGALALAGLLVMRNSGLNLTHGAALGAGMRVGRGRPGHVAAVLAVPVRAGPGDGGAGGGGGGGGVGGRAGAPAPARADRRAGGRRPVHPGRADHRGRLRCGGAGAVAGAAVHAVTCGGGWTRPEHGCAGARRARTASRLATGARCRQGLGCGSGARQLSPGWWRARGCWCSRMPTGRIWSVWSALSFAPLPSSCWRLPATRVRNAAGGYGDR